MKLYDQNPEVVWDYSASLIAASSVSSPSFYAAGYSRIVGIVFTDASLSTACGVFIEQSATSTPNWDGHTKSALTISGSMLSAEVVGRYARISLHTGATCAASTLRAYFWLRPV